MASEMQQLPSGDPRIVAARSFLRSQSDIESANRIMAKDDLAFSYGDQWPEYVQSQRTIENRPMITNNRLGAYIRRVCNNQRQQRPRIRANAADGRASRATARVISGMLRNIQSHSQADTAFDTAYESAIRAGWGYWRVITRYCRDNSFDQEVAIEPIDNPFSVYMDGFAMDGSDAENALITDLMPKSKFRQLYPDADDGANWPMVGNGDDIGNWIEREYLRVAEHFYTARTPDTLIGLSTGDTMFASEVTEQVTALWDMSRIEVVRERPVQRKRIKWVKLTALEVLEERDWPGRWIPIVPVYGSIEIRDGYRYRFGLTRDAKDPQRMANFWSTAATEWIGAAPKSKWLKAEGQDEGYEQEWRTANVDARASLTYKPVTDQNGQTLPPPQRIQPEPPPEGIVTMLQTANSDLSAVLGIVDPAMRIGGNVSGKALNAERLQSDEGTFNFTDNLTRSMHHTGCIIIDMIRWIYTGERVMRIIGEDSRDSLVTVNQTVGDKVINDLTIGEYAVEVDAGPGYESRRQQSSETLVGLMDTPLGIQIAEKAPDVVVRDMDLVSADAIADRLAAANPLAQQDELPADFPDEARAMIQGLRNAMAGLQQQLEQANMVIKSRADVEGMKAAAATHREQIKAETERHSDTMWAQEERDQFESVERTRLREAELRRSTSLDVAELNAVARLVAEMIRERGASADREVELRRLDQVVETASDD
ncbi:MAG: hypothetical protein IT325_09830 [Anaerolineae bacterium]|nr:hypothetical protein [Anaerolineae bacterium]